MKRKLIDSARSHELLMEYKESRVCSEELGKMLLTLYRGMTGWREFRGYDLLDKQDMVTQALIDFLRWGHNYSPAKVKSANGAATFLMFNATRAMLKIVKTYYRHHNVDVLISDADYGLCEFSNDEYNNNLIADRYEDGTQEKV